MNKYIVMIMMVLGLSTFAQAQPVTSYRLAIYHQGATAPVTTYDFQAQDVTWGPLLPDQTGTVNNPSRVTFRHDSRPGQEGIWADPGTGPLFALPFGSQVYQSTLRAVNSAGMGPESARSNLFTRLGVVPLAPTVFMRSGS